MPTPPLDDCTLGFDYYLLLSLAMLSVPTPPVMTLGSSAKATLLAVFFMVILLSPVLVSEVTKF